MYGRGFGRQGNVVGGRHGDVGRVSIVRARVRHGRCWLGTTGHLRSVALEAGPVCVRIGCRQLSSGSTSQAVGQDRLLLWLRGSIFWRHVSDLAGRSS